MKVVINRCFGGFGISEEAARWMAEKGSEHARQEIEEYEARKAQCAAYAAEKRPAQTSEERLFDIDLKYRGEPQWFGHMSELPRDDPHLVAAVEALGEKANGEHASLRVVEIPDGTDYEIDEYDGNERVAEKHRTWS